MPYIRILLIHIPKRGICIYTGHFTEDASLNTTLVVSEERLCKR